MPCWLWRIDRDSDDTEGLSGTIDATAAAVTTTTSAADDDDLGTKANDSRRTKTEDEWCSNRRAIPRLLRDLAAVDVDALSFV